MFAKWVMKIVVAGAGLWLLSAHAGPAIDLIDASDVANEKLFVQAHPTPVVTKSVPQAGAPVIQMVYPKEGSEVAPPFPVKLNFMAAQGAQIEPSSFKVYYGFMGLDITDRILARVKPSATGLDLDQANIPAGNHRIKIQIRDNQGRIGESVISLNVVKR